MIRIQSAAATHVGQVRENNQDRALVSGQLAAVADGMGGHAGGDKAAALAIAELSGVSGTISDKSLIKVVQAANKRIFKVALAPELRGMGTTMVAAIVDNDTELMSMVNVGDSRGYQLRDGVLRQVTDDHSLVKDLLRAGRLTEEEARVHPQRNIVTRVLGISEDVDVDLFTIELEPGDRYVLCSDGLTDEVDDAGIAEILLRSETSADAADELVTVAVKNGGRDNVTVAVLDILAVQSQEEQAPPTGLLDEVEVDAQQDNAGPVTEQMLAIEPDISDEGALQSRKPPTIVLAVAASLVAIVVLIILWLVITKTSGETASAWTAMTAPTSRG